MIMHISLLMLPQMIPSITAMIKIITITVINDERASRSYFCLGVNFLGSGRVLIQQVN